MHSSYIYFQLVCSCVCMYMSVYACVPEGACWRACACMCICLYACVRVCPGCLCASRRLFMLSRTSTFAFSDLPATPFLAGEFQGNIHVTISTPYTFVSLWRIMRSRPIRRKTCFFQLCQDVEFLSLPDYGTVWQGMEE